MAPRCQFKDPWNSHKSCKDPVVVYRQCGRRGCEVTFAYCDRHGGDVRATMEIKKHILLSHDEDSE